MKIECEVMPALAPIWMGYKSYSGSTPDGRTFYVVLPKKSLEGKPNKVKVSLEIEQSQEIDRVNFCAKT